jgi:rhodanese-related sulfurtransferase
MPPALARRPTLALAVFPVLLALGCDIKTSDRDLVFVGPNEATEKLNARGTLFEKAASGCLVDPRSAADYAKGHIKGAVNLPLVEIEQLAGVRLAGHNLFIVYGDGFQDPMAKAAAKKLIECGIKKDTVFVMEGGLRAWQKDGYALVTGSLPEGGEPKPVEKPKGDDSVEVPEQGVR